MKVSTLVKKMSIIICVLALAIICGGAVFYRSLEAVPFAIGVMSTSALNILKAIMIERTTRKAIDLTEENEGKNYVRLQYIIRYLLTGLVLVAAALTPFISLWGAILGIFTLQLSAIIARLMKFDEKYSEV
ncbi:MAG: ATP synthase subunit I [Oscillospiraceae bacterium]|nr:ATP synthase subunit I [Oscillospiraceae bacterium]